MDKLQIKLWETEQEIMDVIHEVCIRNNLHYSLADGTLLGAVRHQGFIPWDDDIDLMMPREDYEKLLEIWEIEAPQVFLLETERNTDDNVNNFAKIRKNHTTFLQHDSERTEKHHKGIFVDIFPMDRRAEGWVGQRVQYALFAVNLLYTRGHGSGSGGLIGAAEKILLRIIPKSAYRALSIRAGELSRKWNRNRTGEWLSPCTIRECRIFYPSDLFDEYILLAFNGKQYFAVKKYETYLSIQYGDYLQLPPEEERVWKHRPIIIDFEHNYEELERFS